MLLFFYNFVLTLAFPLLVLRLYWRSLRAPGYRRRIGERFGAAPYASGLDRSKPCLWIHAVSVGETVAAAPLVRAVQDAHPDLQVVITTMTPTGSDQVRALFADSVLHSYTPYDHSWLLNRFLGQVRPDVVIIMETELWPNMVHVCSRWGIKLMLANARLSAKSAVGYRRFASISRDMLARFDVVAAQSDADRDRLVELGAGQDRTHVTGSLKFNVTLSNGAPHTELFTGIKASGRPVWIAASTRDGEEEKVYAAFAGVLREKPETLLILVPRHPERFDKVAELGERLGLVLQRRSRINTLADDTQVLLGDSMGELVAYYRCADVAFVGGSLVDMGCQNVLEPAGLGLPVIVGPSQFNFAAICRALEKAGALKTVPDSDSLAQSVIELLQHPEQIEYMGRAGKRLVADNQQALPRHLSLLNGLLAK